MHCVVHLDGCWDSGNDPVQLQPPYLVLLAQSTTFIVPCHYVYSVTMTGSYSTGSAGMTTRIRATSLIWS
jgi:hypothetical protein